MRRNERGFAVYTEFSDWYGKRCSVVRSSAMGIRAVWIQNEIEMCGSNPIGNACLTVPMAKKVVKSLQRFIDGEE